MSYQKFVIISYLRSGTHLLRTALESHPHIVCQTEVFNSDNPNLPYPLTLTSQQVLDNWVYKDFTSEVHCAGFVLQAYHPYGLTALSGVRANPHWNDIWPILQHMPNLKVIHLRRQNLLRRHLSHIRARTSQQWHNWSSAQLPHISLLETPPANHIDQYQKLNDVLTLDPTVMQQDFTEVNLWQQRAEELLSHHNCCHVLYEDIHDNFHGECSRILSFLGVGQQTLKSGVNKLENRPLSQSIANYAELKSLFQHTPWISYFED